MWEIIQVIGGAVGFLAVVIVAALMERMRRVFATKEDLVKESQDRKTADGHQDERIMDLARNLHSYMGKIDLLRDQTHERDREREREIAKLRTELRQGFARVEAKLDRNGR